MSITPLTKISFKNNKSNIYIKRDDLNNNLVQGNKLRKLKYNFIFVNMHNYNVILTFGGAYSNHLLATAAYAQNENIPAIGIVRGSELSDNSKWSDTLKNCAKFGMQLYFISRSEYKKKEHSDEVKKIIDLYQANFKDQKVFIIPEGGSNHLALDGVAEVVDECRQQLDNIDYIFCACGTAGTMSGLIDGIYNSTSKPFNSIKLIGIAVLKSANFLQDNIYNLSKYHQHVDWQILYDYHFGGYAKYNQLLLDYIEQFENTHGILCDQVYTGKLFYAVENYIEQNEHEFENKNIIIYHSGGTQGKLKNI